MERGQKPGGGTYQLIRGEGRHGDGETPLRVIASPRLRVTERQEQVLRLVAEGLTYRQVGEKLSLSEATVRYHMIEVMHMLHLENRNQVIAYAGKMGLKEDKQ